MKKLMNTLYVTSENSYLALDGENIVVYEEKNEVGRLPLHNLEGIVSFGYRGTSPALMGVCADRNISLCYLTPQGKFLARVTGKVKGNVILRQQQYQSSQYIQNCQTKEQLRGYEGEAASVYFGVLDELILQQKKDFTFQGRNKRPPLDNMNAMLSFVYTLLTNTITSALECVGLDPYVGYLHTDRPGRASLSLDLIEELRSVLADRFVLSLVNKKIVSGKNFKKKENGAVLMDDELRK